MSLTQHTANKGLPSASRQPQPTIALLPWGNVIEDFLDSIGVSFEAFCNEMAGGWLFGYIDALQIAGVRTVLFCISARVAEPSRFTHRPTGATICVLPVPQLYRLARRPMVNPYGWTLWETFGNARGLYRAPILFKLLKDVSPYLATPLWSLARELRREGCQAILCQEYEYARFDACVLLGQLLRLPVFATFQGGNWQMSRLERPLRPLTLQACSGLVVATQTEMQRLQTHYSIAVAKLAQIFNPIDLKQWEPIEQSQARAVLKLPHDAQIVVWHGRVDLYRKGLDLLLEAWAQVCQKLPEQNLRLLLVGTGSDADELHRRITEMNLQGVIWINQYVLDRTMLRHYLSAADVYVLASRHEGFPVAPIEAMACGLPIVATAAPGIPDILQDHEASGGLIVPCEDAAAIAQALEQILTHEKQRQTLGSCARRRVESYFSLEAVGQQLCHFFATHGLPAETQTRC